MQELNTKFSTNFFSSMYEQKFQQPRSINFQLLVANTSTFIERNKIDKSIIYFDIIIFGLLKIIEERKKICI